MQKPRSFPLWLILAGASWLALPAWADKHALIMGISEYQGSIPKLNGVPHDIDHARQMATRMGVPQANQLVLTDAALTLDGMTAAFDQLIGRVGEGDQVFVYYSGHGGRQTMPEDSQRCSETLVTVSGQGFYDYQLIEKLTALSNKASRVIMMADSCHSGGLSTRSLAKGPVAKSYVKAGESSCRKPVNILTRGITPEGNRLPEKVSVIAMARDNEVAFDTPENGGMGTNAWLQCLSAKADTDKSGAVTLQELRDCAQPKLNAALKGNDNLSPSTITLHGNPDAPFALVAPVAEPIATPPASQPAAPAPAVIALPVVPLPALTPAAPAAEPPPASTPVLPEANPALRANPVASLRDIFSARSVDRIVSVKPSARRLKIGQDQIRFEVTSSHDGYLYVLMVGSDGKTFDLLFPNKEDGSNQISAGQTRVLPGNQWQLDVAGPKGEDHLLVLVTDSPRDFTSLGMEPAGPFSLVDARVGKASQLQDVITHSGTLASCRGNNLRNLQVNRNCSDHYGAAFFTVTEIE